MERRESRDPEGPTPDDADAVDPAEPRPIRCVACGHPITTREDALSVDGRHDHRCVNPHGHVFDVGCFGAAPGLVAVGAPEAFFSWFRGTTWQVGLCGGCHAHLGWAFSGREAPFVALVLDRVRDG